jgi:hypothetical protein
MQVWETIGARFADIAAQLGHDLHACKGLLTCEVPGAPYGGESSLLLKELQDVGEGPDRQHRRCKYSDVVLQLLPSNLGVRSPRHKLHGRWSAGTKA